MKLTNGKKIIERTEQDYKKNINIVEDKAFTINRSLDSSNFKKLTGFHPQPWHDLIVSMHNFS